MSKSCAESEYKNTDHSRQIGAGTCPKATTGKAWQLSVSLKLYQRVLSQNLGDSDKIYSLHEPDVKYYATSEEDKKFEFSSKAPILIDQQTVIILGAINFTETLHDSKIIPDVLEQ